MKLKVLYITTFILVILFSIYLIFFKRNFTPKLPTNSIITDQQKELQSNEANIYQAISYQLKQTPIVEKEEIADDETTIKNLIKKTCLDNGYDNYNLLIRLAKCESTLNPNATIYEGGGLSRGLYQINSNFHKDIDDNCSFDIECSTRFVIEKFKEGKHNLWSCIKFNLISKYK